MLFVIGFRQELHLYKVGFERNKSSENSGEQAWRSRESLLYLKQLNVTNVQKSNSRIVPFFPVCVARGELRSERGLFGSGDAWSRWQGALVPLQREGCGEHPGTRFAPWRRFAPQALLWGRGSEEGDR